ncbi:MAG: MXAN_5187 family protein [Minicystis sp.]
MLLTRFWSILLALALGFSAFTLFVAVQMFNHAGSRAMSQALTADSSAVDWYLRDDARKRAAAIIPIALSPDIVQGLAKATGDAKVDRDTRGKVKTALSKLVGDVAPELKFDAVWAVDANGRIIAAVGFEHSEDWELGGYSSVADAIHGWIRDDAWVWRGRIYRVVTRPVEREVQGEPVGAIVGAKIVDDLFAGAVTKRTGAAVAFYADGARVASGAPEGFDKANLDEITSDLKALDGDKDYQEKGRSEVRVLRQHLGVVYARLPGEAWELGSGYAVGHQAVSVSSPFDFLTQADNTDKAKVPTVLLGLIVVAMLALGLVLSFLEYNRPLTTFHKEVIRLAKGEIDVLSPSRFRGAYKKIAADLNDGMEKVAAKGGAPRRAADLEQVLGPIPAQPSMSAFSVPGASSPGPAPSVESPSRSGRIPVAPPASRLRQSGQSGQMAAVTPDAEVSEPIDVRTSAPTPVAEAPKPPAAGAKPPPAPPKRPPPGAPQPAAAPQPSSVISLPNVADMAAAHDGEFDELADWRKVYEEFLALKKQCGEDTASLTFEKFKGTLQRNKDALVQRHNCTRVKFTVYEKEGKAALKASPVK